ncbi:hypothetical protein D9M68_827890 [compost metagenome]
MIVFLINDLISFEKPCSLSILFWKLLTRKSISHSEYSNPGFASAYPRQFCWTLCLSVPLNATTILIGNFLCWDARLFLTKTVLISSIDCCTLFWWTFHFCRSKSPCLTVIKNTFFLLPSSKSFPTAYISTPYCLPFSGLENISIW